MKIDKNRIKIFYSYSHADEELRDSFEKHMAGIKRKGIIEEWHDRKILAGESWEKSISKKMQEADIVLFLISSDFLASDYCMDKEVTKSVERHNNGLTTVVPIILRYCDWEGTPFETIQGLPTDMHPIMSKHWETIDEAFTNVVIGLKKIISNKLEEKEESLHPDFNDLNDLNVHFRDSNSGKEASVLLDRSITFKEAIAELIINDFLEPGNNYFCWSKKKGKNLDNESSFVEAEITDNDTIIIGVKK